MRNKLLPNSVAGIAIAMLLVTSAHAEISIQYPAWTAELVLPAVAAFEAATGETVNTIELPAKGYVDRIALDFSAGTAADVVVIDSFVVGELASDGYLLPLDERLNNWDQYKYYMPGLLDVVSTGGNVYALPTDTDVRMLWYSKALFDQAGISLPWSPKSWKDIIDAAQLIKDNTDAPNAWLLPAGPVFGEGTTMNGFYMLLLGADTAKDDRNRLRNNTAGKWIGDSPALRRTLEIYHEIYTEKKLTTAAANYVPDLGVALRDGMKNQTLGIYNGGSWDNTCLWDCSGKNIPSQEERNKVLGWAEMPGSGYPGAPKTTNISGGWAIAINNKSSNPDLSFALMTTIFDKDNFARWTLDTSRMAVRTDISQSKEYLSQSFLAKATALLSNTTGRDTSPGYKIVSGFIQQATTSILDGDSVEAVINEYHANLVDEFGADNVITYK